MSAADLRRWAQIRFNTKREQIALVFIKNISDNPWISVAKN